MTKKLLLTTSVLAMLMGISQGSQANEPIASIGEPEGRVLISQGENIVSARSGMLLHAGDRVFTMEKSRVAVIYSDSCVVRLTEHSLLTLKKADECQLGAAVVRNVSNYQNQPIGDALGAGTPPLSATDLGVLAGFTAIGAGVAATREENKGSPD